MYRKEEIVYVDSPILYLRFGLTNDNVSVWLYNTSLSEDVYSLDRVHTLSISLFNNQFAIDDDKNALFFSPSIVGNYVRIAYYSEGDQNPFYASSNLHQFITKVLAWSGNRIIDGLYIHWTGCSNDISSKTIQAGSVIYNNQLYIYPGGTFDIKLHAPPTIRGTYRAYYLFVNEELLSDKLNRQTKIMSDIGILRSTVTHSSIDAAKLDVMSLYDSLYESEPLKVCFAFVLLTEENTYELWVEYPNDHRAL